MATMPRKSVRLNVTLFAFILLTAVLKANAQQPTAIVRTGGIDDGSGISWVHLALEGTLVSKDAAPAIAPPPTLTAQCTQTKSGKQKFEMLVDFGGVQDRAFYPPWRPANDRDLYPPRLEKIIVTMEFLGYTHVKPVKRQWIALQKPDGELQYNTPSGSSSNMEEIAYYLRFLMSLPTLRLTAPGRPATDFLTTPLLDAIRKEPLCKASGL
jgi:hypothetical protein